MFSSFLSSAFLLVTTSVLMKRKLLVPLHLQDSKGRREGCWWQLEHSHLLSTGREGPVLVLTHCSLYLLSRTTLEDH